MKSAFGIKLGSGTDKRYLTGGDSNKGASVSFFKADHGWTGQLRIGDLVVVDNIGSASPAACYRSLRGRVRNLAIGLRKLGINDGGRDG